MHPRNPYHRVDCVPTARRLRVEVFGDVLVDTTATVGVYETSLAPRLYVSRDELRADVLRPSSTTTYCPYKGTATYWSAAAGRRQPDGRRVVLRGTERGVRRDPRSPVLRRERHRRARGIARLARTDRDSRRVSTSPPAQHILSELGFAVTQAGDGLEGTARIVPELCVPGTPRLRTSLLATWTDHLCGMLAVMLMAPLVPVTLELDVHLFAPAPGSGTIRCTGRTLKAGRSVFLAGVAFTAEDGSPIAVGGGSFMTAPDPSLRLPEKISLDGPPPQLTLDVPLAQRAGCERREPGVAVLPRSHDGLEFVQHGERGADRPHGRGGPPVVGTSGHDGVVAQPPVPEAGPRGSGDRHGAEHVGSRAGRGPRRRGRGPLVRAGHGPLLRRLSRVHGRTGPRGPRARRRQGAHRDPQPAGSAERLHGRLVPSPGRDAQRGGRRRRGVGRAAPGCRPGLLERRRPGGGRRGQRRAGGALRRAPRVPAPLLQALARRRARCRHRFRRHRPAPLRPGPGGRHGEAAAPLHRARDHARGGQQRARSP